MALSIGIVGLPNVGKSTLFTALTNKGGLAANYPFATIEPNVGIVPVPDARMDRLAEIDNPDRIVPATVEFVDIAGLVEGASHGEGLGNQFLHNIRETDAICEVVRFFSDPDVVHVAGKVDPASDVETIKTELVLADLATIEKAKPRLEKDAKRGKDAAKKLDAVLKVEAGLNEGKRALQLDLTDEERELIYDLHLLTMKPMLYIANVDEDALDSDFAEIDGVAPVPISAKVEADLAEVRAWTIPIGAKAPQAAGTIHTDFERGFIKAETASFEDYSAYDGEKGCRDAGKLRQEGKDYVVQDGDVMHFKFNV